MSTTGGLLAWVKRWGAAVSIAFLIGGLCSQYVAPVAIFILVGNRKLALMETEVAAIKRRQIEQCHVNYSAMFWMVSVSNSLKVAEPPGARAFVESWPGVCEGAASFPLVNGAPSWLGNTYAGTPQP